MQVDEIKAESEPKHLAAVAIDRPVSDVGQKFLTFDVADRVFAAEVLYVREVLDVQPITPLPGSPHHIEGVVDVRGSSIPIVSISGILGTISDPTSENTRIIVFEAPGQKTSKLSIGILADRVRDVCQIEASEIEAPPPFGDGRPKHSAVTGLCRLEDKLVVIVDLSEIVADMGFSF